MKRKRQAPQIQPERLPPSPFPKESSQEERGKQTLRVFMSYAGVDREYARKLYSLLSQRSNLHIFTTEMLNAGENWESRLKEELSQCDIFVVLLSSSSVVSRWILYELGAAWALNKRIIAVVTHPEIFSKIPLTLRETQLIEIKDVEKPGVIDQILEGYEEVATSRKSR